MIKKYLKKIPKKICISPKEREKNVDNLDISTIA